MAEQTVIFALWRLARIAARPGGTAALASCAFALMSLIVALLLAVS